MESTQYDAIGTPLVDKNAWRLTAAADDPWAAERPPRFECPDYAFEVEPGGFEIDTGDCEYAVVQQPSLAPIVEGDQMALIFWHNTLVADMPTEAHIAVRIGKHAVWQQTVPIPGPSAAYVPTAVAHFSAPAGTPIFLHLHNHGANTYLFSTFEVRRPKGSASGE